MTDAATARAPAQRAIELMTAFADRTWGTSERPAKRYLWTDAFAVCTLLGLARQTADVRYTELALRLIDDVHSTLGKRRSDAAVAGWLSGLSADEGARHPTRGGLRIGKPLPERGPHEPFDEQLEWERDGQYFHYLTKWMHALDQAARHCKQPRFNLWARELAECAHRAFLSPAGAGRVAHLAWKMSVDLTRPLVSAQGQHDPLDGFITCAQLRATAFGMGLHPDGPLLSAELESFTAMLQGQRWTTADPLGIGGLLADALRLAQLIASRSAEDDGLLYELLRSIQNGMQAYLRSGQLQAPASQRLAFRELGLAIGLSGNQALRHIVQTHAHRFPIRDLGALLRQLANYDSLAQTLIAFWTDADRHKARSWSEHRDINDVMLATACVPDAYLMLVPIDTTE